MGSNRRYPSRHGSAVPVAGVADRDSRNSRGRPGLLPLGSARWPAGFPGTRNVRAVVALAAVCLYQARALPACAGVLVDPDSLLRPLRHLPAVRRPEESAGGALIAGQ